MLQGTGLRTSLLILLLYVFLILQNLSFIYEDAIPNRPYDVTVEARLRGSIYWGTVATINVTTLGAGERTK